MSNDIPITRQWEGWVFVPPAHSASWLHSVQSLLQINLKLSHPLSTGPVWDLKEGGMSFIHFKDYIVFHHIVLNQFSTPGIFVVTK